MKNNIYTYLKLGIVFLISFIVSLALPVSEILKGIAATPALIALIAAIYQILKDQAAFENKVKISEKEQFFNLGITSHMANVAFDKHSEFCEKYMAELHETIGTLFSVGPTERATAHSANFHKLRCDYSAWLPNDISARLEPFEDAIFKIGNLAGLAKSLQGEVDQREERIAARKEAQRILSQVIEIRESENNIKLDHAISAVKNKIRNILGVNELTKMRTLLIDKAIASLEYS